MAVENIDVLPVTSAENNFVGIISYKDILSAYKDDIDNQVKKNPSISLRRSGLKVLVRGQRLMDVFRNR